METLKFLKLALAISLVSFAVVSCDDDDPKPPTAYDVVAGNFEGTMTCTPRETPEPTALAEGETAKFEIRGNQVIFKAFPLESIITAIVGEELAPGILEKVGSVEYKMGYAAKFNEDQTEVSATLDPKELGLEVNMGTEEEPLVLKIKVTISAATAGKYTLADKKLVYSISVDAVSVDDEAQPGFVPLDLAFTSAKK